MEGPCLSCGSLLSSLEAAPKSQHSLAVSIPTLRLGQKFAHVCLCARELGLVAAWNEGPPLLALDGWAAAVTVLGQQCFLSTLGPDLWPSDSQSWACPSLALYRVRVTLRWSHPQALSGCWEPLDSSLCLWVARRHSSHSGALLPGVLSDRLPVGVLFFVIRGQLSLQSIYQFDLLKLGMLLSHLLLQYWGLNPRLLH